ncbi:MAG: hypothetical protein Kow00117_06000 [Phototrophicales bacterium]
METPALDRLALGDQVVTNGCLKGNCTMYVDVRRIYKFRMYRNDKRDGHLHQQINVAGLV